jgi:hypothetical protein
MATDVKAPGCYGGLLLNPDVPTWGVALHVVLRTSRLGGRGTPHNSTTRRSRGGNNPSNTTRMSDSRGRETPGGPPSAVPNPLGKPFPLSVSRANRSLNHSTNPWRTGMQIVHVRSLTGHLQPLTSLENVGGEASPPFPVGSAVEGAARPANHRFPARPGPDLKTTSKRALGNEIPSRPPNRPTRPLACPPTSSRPARIGTPARPARSYVKKRWPATAWCSGD